MIDVLERQQALDAVLASIADVAPPNWAQVYAGFVHEPGSEPTCAALAVVNLGVRWSFEQLEDAGLRHRAAAHRAACGVQAWTSLELTLDYDGTFDAELGYEPADAGGRVRQRMDRYPRAWVAAHGRAPHGR